MKVLGINGSPREGNTWQMLKWILDSCKSGGAQTELINLSEKNINPCKGCCRTCYGTGFPCIIDDDMEAVSSKMIEADVIILGSPNYFTNISGILKNFIDRTNPLCKPPLLKGKLAAFVCVGARPVNETEFIEKIFEEYCREMKLNSLGSILARATDPKEIEKNEEVKLSCINLGNKILND